MAYFLYRTIGIGRASRYQKRVYSRHNKLFFAVVGLVFLLEGLTLTLSPNTWMVHVFPIVVHIPLDQMVRCKKTMKTSSGRMVKCWITKIYLTNPRTESSIFSRLI
jgi:uncharacterized protein YjeT (DUF2065 family)